MIVTESKLYNVRILSIFDSKPKFRTLKTE